jgi:outer membrane protein
MSPSRRFRRPCPPQGGRIIANPLTLSLALLLAFAGSASAEGWSLERVLAVVRERDPGVRAAHASGASGRAQAAQGWSALSPQVTASAGFTRSDDPAVLFSQKLWQGRFAAPDFAVDRLNHPAPQGAVQAGITVDQPLWNGGREFAAPGLARHYQRAATAMERAAIADRLLGAVEAYAAAVQARENARAAELGLAAARAMRSAAAERYRMGQVPELDTLRAAAREGDARVREIGARRGLALALDHLSRLVMTTVDASSLEASAEPPAPAPDSPGARGELAAAREGAAAAGTEAGMAALRLLPSINSRVALTQYRAAQGGTFEPRWLVAVSADFPLFDGARRVNEWRAARAHATEAKASAQALERDLAVGLGAARVEAAVAHERRDAAAAALAAAEEALRLASLRYRAGLLPLTDLLATDAEASAARAASVEASTAVTLAYYRLLHAQGDLR